MTNEEVMDAFMEGFAKTAEANGFRGDQVKGLMMLAVDLAQRQAHPEQFDVGFRSVIGG